jgi:membrane-bound serine protease (ClpP class)
MNGIVWIAFAVFLFFLCAILLVLEIFIPSFGLLTIMALSALAGGIVICFQFSMLSGWIGIGTAAVLIPVVWYICYKMLPKSSVGRMLIPQNPQRKKGDAIPDSEQLAEMLHETGLVVTPLRPVGMCDFAGKRRECVAETGYIERDRQVEVIRVEGTRLTVRVVNE